jgi:ferritin
METKTYSREELMKHLVNRLKEELADVDTYNSLYEYLMSNGLHEEAREIEKIARDEYRHATMLTDMLEDYGYDVSADQEIMTHWFKAKRAFCIT